MWLWIMLLAGVWCAQNLYWDRISFTRYHHVSTPLRWMYSKAQSRAIRTHSELYVTRAQRVCLRVEKLKQCYMKAINCSVKCFPPLYLFDSQGSFTDLVQTKTVYLPVQFWSVLHFILSGVNKGISAKHNARLNSHDKTVTVGFKCCHWYITVITIKCHKRYNSSWIWL